MSNEYGIKAEVGELHVIVLEAPRPGFLDIEFVLDDGSVERRRCRSMKVRAVDSNSKDVFMRQGASWPA